MALWLVVPLVVAVVVAVLAGRSDSPGPSTAATPGAARVNAPAGTTAGAPQGVDGPPVDVRADAGPPAASLDALVAASDVVVRGRVVAVERGRTIGTSTQGIVTRLVRVQVDDLLAGDRSVVGADGVVVVEEEGWLPDGRAVRVNGVEPTAIDDAGVWFLVQGRSEEFPYTALVSEQGRFFTDPADPTRFVVSGADDALVRSIEALGPDALGTELAGLAGLAP
jgi:hypothetical protein